MLENIQSKVENKEKIEVKEILTDLELTKT
jgi:hypothetical protein